MPPRSTTLALAAGPRLLLLLLALLVALPSGCQRPLRAERRPYRLGLGLLEPQARSPRTRRAELSKRKAPPHAKLAPLDARRQDIVHRARALLGRRFEGNARAAEDALLAAALGEAAPAWRQAPLKPRPRPGDLVVFDQSRDANGNGRLDDPRSGVGIVLARRGARVAFVYLSGGRARKGALHLRRRSLRRQQGRLLNSYVRVKTPKDRSGTHYLAGELLAGFLRVR